MLEVKVNDQAKTISELEMQLQAKKDAPAQLPVPTFVAEVAKPEFCNKCTQYKAEKDEAEKSISMQKDKIEKLEFQLLTQNAS